MSFDLGSVNWLAVPVAALAAFVVGGVWYAALFGKAWARLHGYDNPAAMEAMSKSQARAFGLMFAGYLLAAVVLAGILHANPETAWLDGVKAGAVLWLGIGAGETVLQNAAHRKPVAAAAIDLSHQLVYLCVMGAILGAWH